MNSFVIENGGLNQKKKKKKKKNAEALEILEIGGEPVNQQGWAGKALF